ADLNGLTDQSIEIADGLLILNGTDNEEMAIRVGSLRAAHIQKSDAVNSIDHAIDVGFHAHIFMQMLQRLLRRDTGTLRHGDRAKQQKNNGHTQQDRRTHRGMSFGSDVENNLCFDYEPIKGRVAT